MAAWRAADWRAADWRAADCSAADWRAGIARVIACASLLLGAPVAAGEIEDVAYAAFLAGCIGHRDDFRQALATFDALDFELKSDGFRYHREHDIIGDAPLPEDPTRPATSCLVSVYGGDLEAMTRKLADGFGAGDNYVFADPFYGWLLRDGGPPTIVSAHIIEGAPEEDQIVAFFALRAGAPIE